MTDGRQHHRCLDWWTTIAVVPLPPGWVNQFECVDEDDDEIEYVYSDSPAILLQENRSSTECWEVVIDGEVRLRSRDIDHDPPFPTRATFGEVVEALGIHPAVETGGYVTTEFKGARAAECNSMEKQLIDLRKMGDGRVVRRRVKHADRSAP